MTTRRSVIAGLAIGAASVPGIAGAIAAGSGSGASGPGVGGRPQRLPAQFVPDAGGPPVPHFPSRAAAEAAHLPTNVDRIELGGYALAGDGGAAGYVWTPSEPAFGGLRSADGAWWVVDEPVIRPEMFGALGDGSDELSAMNAFMAALGDGVSGVIDRTHGLSAWTTLADKADFRLSGTGGLRLLDGAPTTSGHGALLVSKCTRFQISGITLDGNRANREPQPRSAHLLLLRSCSDFVIRDITARDGTCDGVHLDSATPADEGTHCRHFVLENLHCENNFRVGMSIIQARHFVIRGGRFVSGQGTMPQAGIDLESDDGNPTGSIRHGRIEDVLFEDNVGYGLQVSHRSEPRDIAIRNCTFTRNVRGAIFCGMHDSAIVDCLFEDSPNGMQHAVVFVPGVPHVANIDIVRPRFRSMTYWEEGKPLILVAGGGGGFVRVDGLDVDACMAAAAFHAGDCTLENSRIDGMAEDAGIHATKPRFRLSRNRVSRFRNRAALIEGPEARIVDNDFLDPVVNSVSGVVVVTGAAARIDGNTIRRQPASVGYGLIVSASFLSLQGNVVDGFRGDPYMLTGAAATEALGAARNNVSDGTRLPEN